MNHALLRLQLYCNSFLQNSFFQLPVFFPRYVPFLFFILHAADFRNGRKAEIIQKSTTRPHISAIYVLPANLQPWAIQKIPPAILLQGHICFIRLVVRFQLFTFIDYLRILQKLRFLYRLRNSHIVFSSKLRNQHKKMPHPMVLAILALRTEITAHKPSRTVLHPAVKSIGVCKLQIAVPILRIDPVFRKAFRINVMLPVLILFRILGNRQQGPALLLFQIADIEILTGLIQTSDRFIQLNLTVEILVVCHV